MIWLIAPVRCVSRRLCDLGVGGAGRDSGDFGELDLEVLLANDDDAKSRFGPKGLLAPKYGEVCCSSETPRWCNESQSGLGQRESAWKREIVPSAFVS